MAIFSKKLSQVGFLCFFEGLHLENVPIFWVVFRVFSARSACYDQNFLMSVKSEFFATKNIFIIFRENAFLWRKTQKTAKKTVNLTYSHFFGFFFLKTLYSMKHRKWPILGGFQGKNALIWAYLSHEVLFSLLSGYQKASKLFKIETFIRNPFGISFVAIQPHWVPI